jgi:hypothetical protein
VTESLSQVHEVPEELDEDMEPSEAEHIQAASDQEWTSDFNADSGPTNEEQLVNLSPSDQPSPDTAAFPNYLEGIIALAGIVAFRLANKFPELVGEPFPQEQMDLPTWLQSHSRSDYCHPSSELRQQAQDMDVIFLRLHGLQLVDKRPGVMRRFQDEVMSKHPDMIRFDIL